MKELLENNLNSYSSWCNKTERTMLVALFNEHGVFIKSLRILPCEFVIVPPNTTLKLISFSQ